MKYSTAMSLGCSTKWLSTETLRLPLSLVERHRKQGCLFYYAVMQRIFKSCRYCLSNMLKNSNRFNEKCGSDIDLHYRHNKRMCVIASILHVWLHYVDCKVEQTINRKIVLIIDNSGAHDPTKMLLMLQKVKKLFLPPSTTSRLQPLDTCINATIK